MVIAISVGVGLICRVAVATEPTGLWPVLWIGELDLLGTLQAERIGIREMDSDRSLNDFNVSFMILMKLPQATASEVGAATSDT